MKNSLMARLRGQHEEEGFTLVELLIVIVILGILAAIVVFSVSGVQNTSKQSACQTNVKTIDTALEAYYAQNSQAVSADSTYTVTNGAFDVLVAKGLLHDDSNIVAPGNSINEGGSYTLTYVAPGQPIGSITAGNAGGVSVSNATCSGG